MSNAGFALVDEVKVGDTLIADGVFTCLKDGERLRVKIDKTGLHVRCNKGKHYLDGQIDEVNDRRVYSGFKKEGQ